jgi:hypothetical protein
MWNFYGDSYDSDSDFANAEKTIRFKLPVGGIIEYFRTWIVGYIDPSFTSITADIYNDVNGSKGGVLYSSSTSFVKSQITTKDNFVKEIYFKFDKVPLDSENWYHFALKGVSSGFSEDSHIAWKVGYPFPVYPVSANIAVHPYLYTIIGAPF